MEAGPWVSFVASEVKWTDQFVQYSSGREKVILILLLHVRNTVPQVERESGSEGWGCLGRHSVPVWGDVHWGKAVCQKRGSLMDFY